MTGTDPEPERMLRVMDAADRLSCSRGYVYLLMRRGELEYIEYPAASEGARLSGRRIPESAIAAFLNRYRVTAGGALETRKNGPAPCVNRGQGQAA